MSEIKHESIDNIPQSHKNEHEGYEYYRRKFVSFGEARNTSVSVYEIPPKKAAYPYHFHRNNEETFYIISGEGVLRTPSDKGSRLEICRHRLRWFESTLFHQKRQTS